MGVYFKISTGNSSLLMSAKHNAVNPQNTNMVLATNIKSLITYSSLLFDRRLQSPLIVYHKLACVLPLGAFFLSTVPMFSCYSPNPSCDATTLCNLCHSVWRSTISNCPYACAISTHKMRFASSDLMLSVPLSLT